jgi:hypothetical protein
VPEEALALYTSCKVSNNSVEILSSTNFAQRYTFLGNIAQSTNSVAEANGLEAAEV